MTVLALLLTGLGVGVPEETLAERVQAVLPRPPEERWREIPWRRDLLQARREANETGKPIFMWIMNGNPLACT